MSEEAKPVDAEIVPREPRFNLKNAKSPTYNERVDAIMSHTKLERWQVEGVLGDLVMQKQSRETQAEIAKRWGVAFGQVSSCRNMAKLTIEEHRGMLASKSLALANMAADRLMDSMQTEDLKAKDLLAITKAMTDNALNLETKTGAPQAATNISVGDVQILIQNRQEREKQGGSDVAQRLIARGLNPALVEKAIDQQAQG